MVVADLSLVASAAIPLDPIAFCSTFLNQQPHTQPQDLERAQLRNPHGQCVCAFSSDLIVVYQLGKIYKPIARVRSAGKPINRLMSTAIPSAWNALLPISECVSLTHVYT